MGRCAGAFAEYALMEAAETMLVPAGLAWEQAASIPLVFLVTFDMLVLQGRLKAGEWLLVNGVSSGVGVASLQLGKALGARVIGTSGSAAKLAVARIRSDSTSRCARAAGLRAGGHGRDRRARRGPGREHRRRLRCSPRTSARWPSRAGSPPSATWTAWCTPTSTSAPCTRSDSPVRRLQQAAHQGAARRGDPAFRGRGPAAVRERTHAARIDRVVDFDRLAEAKAAWSPASTSARSSCAWRSRS